MMKEYGTFEFARLKFSEHGEMLCMSINVRVRRRDPVQKRKGLEIMRRRWGWYAKAVQQ